MYKKEFTISNLLTASRLLFAPIVMYLILDSRNYLALFVFIIAMSTDFFDGYLARLRKETSKLGKFLDPIADKILYCFVLFGILIKNSRMIWIIILIIVIFLYIIGYLLFVKKKIKISLAGRISHFLEFFVICAMILGFVNSITLFLFAILAIIPSSIYIGKILVKR